MSYQKKDELDHESMHFILGCILGTELDHLQNNFERDEFLSKTKRNALSRKVNKAIDLLSEVYKIMTNENIDFYYNGG